MINLLLDHHHKKAPNKKGGQKVRTEVYIYKLAIGRKYV